MFQTNLKKYQVNYYSRTWQQSIRNRQIARNSYRRNGDIKKAKAFANMVSNFTFQPVEAPVEHIIFSYV